VTRVAVLLSALALWAALPMNASAASTACGRTGAVSDAADLAAIAAFNVEYLKAINAGDIKALSSLTDDDHIMLAPGRPPLVGKAANDTANGRAYEQFNIVENWVPLETVIDGNLAYQRGTFTVAATPKAGGAARATSGNFLRIYRRQSDGSWRMTRDMFNAA
jgi:ketosteroid isomerase-like protein